MKNKTILIMLGMFLLIGFIIAEGNYIIYSEDKLLKSNCYVTGHISGKSMNPYFYDGDKVTVDTCNNQELNIGDIIVFNILIDGKDELYIHRIIGFENDCVITKGDNRKTSDGCIKYKNIYGKYIIRL